MQHDAMRHDMAMGASRRHFFKLGAGIAATAVSATLLPTMAHAAGSIDSAYPRGLKPELLRQALAALNRLGSAIPFHDRIAVADFNAPSSQPRLHLIDLPSGATTALLVAHGSGSDPEHSGWLQRFSNEPGSYASCEGAFLASDYYVGKHGQSQRLVGLDPTNDNALPRAIVIHSAWYANPDMLETHGQLGRSEGCFAVGDRDLPQLFERLGPGRMLYAAKV
ncbi:murein L,D-transpeptidase catalytic domain family protein [soil metagenome]